MRRALYACLMAQYCDAERGSGLLLDWLHGNESPSRLTGVEPGE